MKTKQSFYKKLIPLNTNEHLKLRMSDIINYSFAKKTNAAILTCSEFEKGCKIYPILFIRDGENILPVALFGLQDNQNLFLKWNHQWDAEYIPAHIRRYPFSLANVDGSADYIICIDEKSASVGSSGEYNLFLKNGMQSNYLNEKIRFIKELQIEYEKTLLFTNKINDMGLFEPMNANINLTRSDNLSISGFYTINMKKFKELDVNEHKELIDTNDMKLIYEHFTSLDNFSKLIDIVSERKVIIKTSRNSKKNNRQKEPEEIV